MSCVVADPWSIGARSDSIRTAKLLCLKAIAPPGRSQWVQAIATHSPTQLANVRATECNEQAQPYDVGFGDLLTYNKVRTTLFISSTPRPLTGRDVLSLTYLLTYLHQNTARSSPRGRRRIHQGRVAPGVLLIHCRVHGCGHSVIGWRLAVAISSVVVEAHDLTSATFARRT